MSYLYFYLQWYCPACGKENMEKMAFVRNRNFISEYPVVPFDVGACRRYNCEYCNSESFVDDIELYLGEGN